MESSILIILTGKHTRHSSLFSSCLWGSISTILPHSLSPPQPRKATIRPYPLSWIIVYRSYSSLPNFKQISIPPVFRERLPKLSHCMSAFCDLLPYTCVSLMRHAVQRECAPSSRFFRTPLSREERYRSIFSVRVFSLSLSLILLIFQWSARHKATSLRIAY